MCSTGAVAVASFFRFHSGIFPLEFLIGTSRRSILIGVGRPRGDPEVSIVMRAWIGDALYGAVGIGWTMVGGVVVGPNRPGLWSCGMRLRGGLAPIDLLSRGLNFTTVPVGFRWGRAGDFWTCYNIIFCKYKCTRAATRLVENIIYINPFFWKWEAGDQFLRFFFFFYLRHSKQCFFFTLFRNILFEFLIGRATVYGVVVHNTGQQGRGRAHHGASSAAARSIN